MKYIIENGFIRPLPQTSSPVPPAYLPGQRRSPGGPAEGATTLNSRASRLESSPDAFFHDLADQAWLHQPSPADHIAAILYRDQVIVVITLLSMLGWILFALK